MKKATQASNLHGYWDVNGGDEGDRTPDLLNAIQALSQLSYAPKSFTSDIIRKKSPFVNKISLSCFTIFPGKLHLYMP